MNEPVDRAPPTLALGVIGNCAFNALVDERGSIVWCCLPRPDGDPVFHALLGGARRDDAAHGAFDIEIEHFARATQHYVTNTAILVTDLFDRHGHGVRITDFAPRLRDRGRVYRPLLFIRRLTPLSGRPRVRIRVRPGFEYGAARPGFTRGSNHVRYVHPTQSLRLTCDMPVTYILDETFHLLDRPANLIFGVDETIASGIAETARDFEERTAEYWQHWTRALAVPLEWQEAVIRAAITLKLCMYEETGAIIAAMTTSIPEAPETQRTWDYRYCWLRDAFFVVRALNGLSEVATMENYLRYLFNVADTAAVQGHLQPLYGIALESEVVERHVDTLPGYRGIGPVRVGNQAFEHRRYWPRRRRSSIAGCCILPASTISGAWNGWASARSRCTTNPMPASGNCARAAACTRRRPSCAGPPAIGWRRSRCTWGLPTARGNGVAAPTRSRRRSWSSRGIRPGRLSSTSSAASISTLACS
jgi:GH15 family glucan-1,4-alpha-glucosidase